MLYLFFILFFYNLQLTLRFCQALGLKRDDTFSVTMLGHCIEMYIGETDAYIGKGQRKNIRVEHVGQKQQ